MKSDDKDIITKKTDALAQASSTIAQHAYAGAPGGESGAAGAGAQPGQGSAGGQGGPGGGQGRENVVDAEFEEVSDKDRKAS